MEVFSRTTSDVVLVTYRGHLNYTLQKYSGKSFKSYDPGVPETMKRKSNEALAEQVEYDERRGASRP